jgi:radical SAM-linked protein
MRKERLVYLSRLGADTKRVRSDAEKAAAAAKVPRGRAAPPRMVQGEARRVRFSYEKLGASAFLSHLDLIRAIPRAFRRLDVPMFYSSGFHPKPDMVFSPALSLGVYSLDEYLDIKLTCDLTDPEELVRNLTEASADGIKFRGGVTLGPNDAGVNKLIDSARYVLAFPTQALPGGRSFLERRTEYVHSASELRILRKIDGLGKWVDVKAFLRTLTVADPRCEEVLARAGLVGEFVPVLCDVSILGSGAVKAHEVGEVLLGAEAKDVPYAVVRARLGGMLDGDIVSPLETARFRKVLVRNARADSTNEGDSAEAPATP